MIKAFEQFEVWFITGAQLLYGGDAVKQVDGHSKEMVDGLNNSGLLPIKVIYAGTANSSKEIVDVMLRANNEKRCIGVITWMHTFSPAKMWIKGLQLLNKPLLHLHTQYNQQIPWDTMDMDFMNLNQSAHGDEKTQKHIAIWERVCAGWADAQDCLILRFGDQMNNVAVTDGDKVAFEQVMGYHVDYCPFSEVLSYFDKIPDTDVDNLVTKYFKDYEHNAKLEDKNTEEYKKIWNSAKAEIAIRKVLEAYGAKGFTTNFDDLGDVEIEQTGHGFDQIPGLASQRLMSEGIGFGAEGDWKSAALYRTTWFMSQGLEGGTSFLEDYTLNFDGENTSILEAHMLEINPDIAEEKPRLEVHFLGIGYRKSKTARLVFTSKQGHGVTATIVDMGNRFRLIANDVNLIKSKPLPKLPVASALWVPEPSFEVGVGCWLNAGGTHHSCFSFGLTDEYWRDFAEIADIEVCIINKDTDYEQFRKELKFNEIYYMLNKALR